MAKDLDYFKKKIMAILEKQTDEAPKEINKSLNDIDYIYNTMNPGTFGEIEKSRGYGIGTVREWKGRKYKKIAPNKWRLIYESDGKGARQSIAYLKKAVMNAKSTDELLEIVMQNVNRFQDANGKTLDIVSELQEAVRSAKTALNGKKEPAASKPAETKKETSTMSDKELEEKNKNLEAERSKIAADIKEGKNIKENGRKLTEVNNEKEKVVNEMAQRKFDAADKEEPKQEEKKEEKPVEPEAKPDNKQQKKELKELMNNFYSDTLSHIAYAKRAGTDASLKAKHYLEAYEGFAKHKDKVAEMTGKKDLPDFPDDIKAKFEELKEAAKGKNFYWLGYDTYKKVTGIRSNKLTDIFDEYSNAITEKFRELKESDEKFSDKAEIVPGKTNEEQAELFEMKEDPNNDERKILFYNGKPYGNDGNSGYVYSNSLEDMKDMVRAVGMDPKAQAKYVFDKFNNNKDQVAYQWSLDSSIKKYGEAKLKELAKPSMSDEEFLKELEKRNTEKSHTYKWLAEQAHNHVYNKMVEATAQKYLDQLTSANSAINDVDIPVDPKDMEEAESIIGHKVDRILARTDSYGKSLYRAELKKMIEARIRNKPGVARAMLVYIKNKQAETGQTIFTPKNEIWNNLQKLNENAINSVMAGESETKGGTSGNLYSGDGVSSVVEDKDAGRYQVTFNGKPDAEIRNVLKQNGFRWAPSLGVWQCYNTANGERSLARVAEKLGWKKGE